MSKFTDIELEYVKTQRLGRLATVNKNGEPQIAPVTQTFGDQAPGERAGKRSRLSS